MTKQRKLEVVANSLPRQRWVERVVKAWREQLTSIFETGNLLEAMKLELDHGEWTAAFRNKEMPFTRQTADKLIKISNNDNLRNDAVRRHLPVSWTILIELTKLTEEQFENGINSGAIHPNMRTADVRALRGIEPKKKAQWQARWLRQLRRHQLQRSL